jgi:hypothetical protein
MYAPISLRRKVFKASAHGCLTTEYRSFRKRRPYLVGWRHAPPRGPPGRALASLRNAHQSRWLRIFKLAIGPALGYRTVRWLRSCKPCVSTPIGFVAQNAPSSESWLRKKRLFFAFLR